MPRGIPNKKVTPEEDDLAVVGTPQPGEQIDGQGLEPASYESEEDEIDEELDEEASIQPMDEEAEELAAAGMHVIEEEDEPDEYDAIVGTIRKAIQSYQEWLRKGVSPDTAFFESKLHDAIKDVKVEDWF